MLRALLMKSVLCFSSIYFLLATGAFAAPPPISAAGALSRYCEPLISGASAAQVSKAAKADGFQDFPVGGFEALRIGELILGISDAPRACLVQAPPSMTFIQAVGIVDAWAARHPGAQRAVANRGPDGAPVKMWIAPSAGKSLLVNQQTNGRGQKVVNFVLAPLAKP